MKFTILRESGDKLYGLASSGKKEPDDFKWGPVNDKLAVGECEEKFVSGFLVSSWARRGFNRTLKCGDEVYVVEVGTNRKIHVLTVEGNSEFTDRTYKKE